MCSNSSLAALDAAVRRGAADAAGQRRWLAGRAAACPIGAGMEPKGAARDYVIDCLDRIYEQRIAELDFARNRALWPKVPFVPSIVAGQGDPMCRALRDDIEAGFRGPALLPDPLGEREIGFAPMPYKSDDDGVLLRADFDPYNRGRKVPVLQSFADNGAMRLALVEYRQYQSAAALAPLLGYKDEGDRLNLQDAGRPIIDPQAFPFDPHKKQVAPIAYFTKDTILDVDETPHYFRYAGRVYLLAKLSPATRGGADLGVYELAGPAQLKQRCLFVGHVPIADDVLEPLDRDLLAVLDRTEAAAGPLLPEGKVCDAYGDAPRTVWDDRQYRPWLLEPRLRPGADIDPASLARYLGNRGLTGLEWHRDYLAYQAARRQAIAFLVPYYVGKFGRSRSEAEHLAGLYFDWETAYGSVIYPDDAAKKVLFAPDFAVRHALQQAIFAGDAGKVTALLAAGKPPPLGSLDEPLIADALDQPLIQKLLLDRGLNVDAVGASGRTPLMTAARLDLVDAAALLLAHGAAIDATAGEAAGDIYRTDDAVCQQEPRPTSDTPGRTALSYAAEKASPAMVKLLLDHGADPGLADNENQRPADYAKGRKPILDLLGAAH